MKILILDIKSFSIEFIVSAFERAGNTVNTIEYIFDNTRKSDNFDNFFNEIVVDGMYDAVFSFNYYPVVSTNCLKHSIKYISWIYDNPQVSLYSYTIINKCNYIFIFDSSLYYELHNSGINTVYFLSLGADTNSLDKFIISDDKQNNYCCDVSFVGSLYNNKHCMYDKLDNISPYTKGYIDSLIQIQSNTYGYYFLQDMLTDDIIAELVKSAPYTRNSDGVESLSYIYADYFLARKTTEIERIRTLDCVSQHFYTNIYTADDTSMLPFIYNKGKIDYYNEMPYVFKCSKINLNITLKSIKKGIPLRAIDIMASHGFLLSNYQEDFGISFEAGKDYVYYEDTADLLNKIDYYLKHDDLRREIADNGYKTVKNHHTFDHKVNYILNTIKDK